MAKQQGWISLHRQIQEHWLWEEKPFDKRSAWIDLLLSANHQDNKFLLGSELVEVKAGSFITSIEKLKEKWGWSNTKVINFLKLLESDGMIVKKSDTKKTVITIEKYSLFQLNDDTKTMQKRYENDARTMREHTNNNDNNDNNDNKERERFVPPTIDEVSAYCKERGNNINPQQFIDYYKSNGWLVGKNKMKDWKASVRSWEKNSYGSKEKERKVTVQRCPELDAIF